MAIDGNSFSGISASPSIFLESVYDKEMPAPIRGGKAMVATTRQDGTACITVPGGTMEVTAVVPSSAIGMANRAICFY